MEGEKAQEESAAMPSVEEVKASEQLKEAQADLVADVAPVEKTKVKKVAKQAAPKAAPVETSAEVGETKMVASKVFPSEEDTIAVEADPDYGGAHMYAIRNCLGFNNGETKYQRFSEGSQAIQFIQKNADGSIIPGLQSEQLVLMLIDRHEKLNAKYPDPRHNRMMAGLRAFLQASKERVQERIERGVMGELKK